MSEKSFFSVYGEVFRRNERYSVVKPVPQLGDLNSSDDDVHAFYDFWLGFRSWRDFSYLNEHQVESAQSREEKRMFIRENEKKQAGKKKEETAPCEEVGGGRHAKGPSNGANEEGRGGGEEEAEDAESQRSESERGGGEGSARRKRTRD